MKKENKLRKFIKIILLIILALVTIIGIIFSFIYAEIDDAPPFSLVGSAITVGFCYLIYRLIVKKL